MSDDSVDLNVEFLIHRLKTAVVISIKWSRYIHCTLKSTIHVLWSSNDAGMYGHDSIYECISCNIHHSNTERYLLPYYASFVEYKWNYHKSISVIMDIFSCDQAALWMVQSVRPSDRLSVRHTFLTMLPSSYHHEMFRNYYQWKKWCPCKRSRSYVKGQGYRGHNPP